MDIPGLLVVIRRWLWLIAAAFLIGGISGFVVSARQPLQYLSTVSLYVSSPNHSDYQSLLGDQEIAKALVAFPQSDPVLKATLAASHDKSLTVSSLSSMISVSNIRQTQFVTIGVRASSGSVAARLAALVARESISQFEAAENDTSARRFAYRELQQLQGEIAALEARATGSGSAISAGTTATATQVTRQLTADRRLYNQIAVAYAAMNGPQVTVIQGARVPASPAGLTGTTSALLGAFVGLIVIAAVILFLEQTSLPRRDAVVPERDGRGATRDPFETSVV